MDKDNALESDSLEVRQIKQLQKLVACVTTPSVYEVLPTYASDEILEKTKNTIKALEFKIAYMKSHPDEDVAVRSDFFFLEKIPRQAILNVNYISLGFVASIISYVLNHSPGWGFKRAQ